MGKNTEFCVDCEAAIKSSMRIGFLQSMGEPLGTEFKDGWRCVACAAAKRANK